jgi:hypothetical protein
MRRLPEVPSHLDVQTRRFLSELRSSVAEMQGSLTPPRPPSNLRATGQAGSILIQFTRSDGETYAIYWNTLPRLDGATKVDVGNSVSWSHNVGQGGVTRYYWVTARRGTLESAEIGPVSAVTAALGATVAPPPPPPASDQPIYSDERGYVKEP